MLAALKQSPESRQLVDLAKKYLTGVKGTLVQHKKLKAEKAAQLAAGGPAGGAGQSLQAPPPGGTQSFQSRPAPPGVPSFGARPAPPGQTRPTQQQQSSHRNELMQAFHQAAAQNTQSRPNIQQYANPTQGANGTGPIPGTSRFQAGKPS
jgi:hypothetical protein